ncbi:MAG: CRISPR-associated helicase Cas3' [Rhodobacteraceae bacterium]|nr:CRISPR-associated helicase Cas3' [Paracoccaceae bacterium]
MANKFFYAHSGTSTDRSDWQLLPDHLNKTASFAAERGHALLLAATAHLAGAYHDLGKYDPAFDRILRGENVQVDHSTAGAKLLLDRAPPQMKPLAEILAYTILGHHAGLPDRQMGESAMAERIANHSYRIPQTILDACQPDFTAAAAEVVRLIRKGPDCGFDASVATRMAFSCLVDADFRDTEAFYARINGTQPDRVWPSLPALLPQLRAAFDGGIAQFMGTTDLNHLRSNILTHVRAQAPQRPGLFTLTVPTGGGKTLASMGFALDHAAAHGHRRIIYAIPYTSIIDQTAKQFCGMFGDAVVLEHHSAIEAEQPGTAECDKLRLAMEDWAAPIVVTTNVQLFESLFAARPSRCRKLHNIAGSVIVLDEAQALPRKLLLPTLRMIDTLAHHYGCTIVLCTATQPAFDSRQLKGGGLPLEGRELAPDPAGLASRLRRARIVQGEAMNDAALIAALRPHPQALMIVNSRKHALNLFRQAQIEGLDGMVHLSTRQFPAHRRRILNRVKERLKAGLPCRLIATSLVEAGVDVDFPIGWRAEAGLDSVVQAAGRVNREGTRDWQDSTLTVFTAPDNPAPAEVAELAKAMRSTAGKFDDLLAPAAIQDWFDEVYWKAQPARLGSKMAECFVLGRGTDFPFRTVAEDYRMIDSPMVPVIIPMDGKAADAVRQLGFEQIPSGTLARALQPFTVQIPVKARELLRTNCKGSFHHSTLRGNQFFVLDEPSLYEDETGLLWEQAEFLAADVSII